MTEYKAALDKFGRFIMANWRDEAIDHVDGLLRSHWKAPALQTLQCDLAALSEDHQAIVRRTVVSAVDVGLHAFLFKLQERADFEGDIQVLVDGKDVATISDGLHGEAFGDNGWQASFSRFGQASTEA